MSNFTRLLTTQLIAAIVLLGISTPNTAFATTCTSTPTTFASLQNAFNSASGTGTTICLGANITGPSSAGSNLSVPASTSLTLDLSGFNLSVSPTDVAGITVPLGTSFTLNATGGGQLTALSTGLGAGIGSNSGLNAGTITINGGTVSATGGYWSAGIGGGNRGIAGSIIINGGTITATGGEAASGIGSGAYKDGGDITITGGTVNATSPHFGAGIGGGTGGSRSVRNFTMSGGTVTATALVAGPGVGVYDGNFTMTGGTLVAVGDAIQYKDFPGISIDKSVGIISGGNVTATVTSSDNQTNSAGILVGWTFATSLSVTGGSITATGVRSGAGIGTLFGGSQLRLPSSGGTPSTAGSGVGAGAIAAVPIVTTLTPDPNFVYSMAGTVDQNSPTPARTVITFSAAPQNSSSSPSPSASPSSSSTPSPSASPSSSSTPSPSASPSSSSTPSPSASPSSSSSSLSSSPAQASINATALATTGFSQFGIFVAALTVFLAGLALSLLRKKNQDDSR